MDLKRLVIVVDRLGQGKLISGHMKMMEYRKTKRDRRLQDERLGEKKKKKIET